MGTRLWKGGGGAYRASPRLRKVCGPIVRFMAPSTVALATVREARAPLTYSWRGTKGRPAGSGARHTPPAALAQPVTATPPETVGCSPGCARRVRPESAGVSRSGSVRRWVPPRRTMVFSLALRLRVARRASAREQSGEVGDPTPLFKKAQAGSEETKSPAAAPGAGPGGVAVDARIAASSRLMARM